jgi:assimilatory nitrate reductase catalytic subunit
MATAVVAHKQSYGFDAPPFTLKDLELSDTLFFIGANPIVAHPIIWDRVRKNPLKKIIVIDPRKSETAINADYWYGAKAKTDLVLFYTIAHLLIEKNYLDESFIKAHTENFCDFKTFLKAFTLEHGSAITGLSKEKIIEITELIHAGKRVSFWWTMGVNQGYEAVRTAQAIINIALMTGNIGKPGTGANSLTGQCNAMGSRLYSNTTALFGGGDFNDPARRAAVAATLQVTDDVLATKPTATYNEIIEGINCGAIKGLWVICTNPEHSWTNNKTFNDAVKKLELFVVQDIYETTESAVNATVFFPVVSGIKKTGTLINMERRLCGLRPCLQKKENEKTDYEVIYGIGKALGMGELLKRWESPASCFELMKACSKDMPSDISGVNWEELENSHGIQWPLRLGDQIFNDERRLYENGEFFTPSKKAIFKFENPIDNPLKQDEQFLYILNNGRGSVGQWHTQTRTKEVRCVDDVCKKNAYLYINAQLANKYNILENDLITVHSINGQKEDFFVKLSENVRYEELYAPMHYIECNRLTPSIYDPYSKEPSYKTTPVWFEKTAYKEMF